MKRGRGVGRGGEGEERKRWGREGGKRVGEEIKKGGGGGLLLLAFSVSPTCD